MTASTPYTTEQKNYKAALFAGIKTALFALAGSALLALSAQFAIPLPFAPVPITMQTFAVLLLAGIFGPKIAALSCLSYLIEGTLGMPVFAHGISCSLWFLTPRVGYVIGFVIAAWVVGKCTEKSANLLNIVLSFAAGEAIILTAGWAGLLFFATPSQAFAMGIAPFVIGALYKLVSASLIVKGIKQITN